MRSWCTNPFARLLSAHARRRSPLWTYALALGIATMPQAVDAQQGAIAGTVSASGTTEVMSGAQVIVAGTEFRATTDDRGRFRLANVPGTNVTLEVRRIGYRVARVPARVGDENVQIVLSLNPTSLDAVVVTGTPGAAQKREIGNAVGQINAADVVEQAPILSMQS